MHSTVEAAKEVVMGYRALFCVVASAATLLILSCSDDPTTFKATVTVVEDGEHVEIFIE